MSGRPKKRGFWTLLQSGSEFAESRRHGSLNCDEGDWSGANFLGVILLKTVQIKTSRICFICFHEDNIQTYFLMPLLNLHALIRRPHNLFSGSIFLSFLNSIDHCHLSVSLGLFFFVSSFQDCIKSCLPYAAADVPP